MSKAHCRNLKHFLQGTVRTKQIMAAKSFIYIFTNSSFHGKSYFTSNFTLWKFHLRKWFDMRARSKNISISAVYWSQTIKHWALVAPPAIVEADDSRHAAPFLGTNHHASHLHPTTSVSSMQPTQHPQGLDTPHGRAPTPTGHFKHAMELHQGGQPLHVFSNFTFLARQPSSLPPPYYATWKVRWIRPHTIKRFKNNYVKQVTGTSFWMICSPVRPRVVVLDCQRRRYLRSVFLPLRTERSTVSRERRERVFLRSLWCQVTSRRLRWV